MGRSHVGRVRRQLPPSPAPVVRGRGLLPRPLPGHDAVVVGALNEETTKKSYFFKKSHFCQIFLYLVPVQLHLRHRQVDDDVLACRERERERER